MNLNTVIPQSSTPLGEDVESGTDTRSECIAEITAQIPTLFSVIERFGLKAQWCLERGEHERVLELDQMVQSLFKAMKECCRECEVLRRAEMEVSA